MISTGNRATTSADSKIIFNIPVHAMNLDSVYVGVKRDIAIALYIGDSKMWAGYQEFVISAADDSVLSPTTNAITIKSVTLLNTGTISVGDGVVFRVVVTVPAGWSSFNNTELVGISGKYNDTS